MLPALAVLAPLVAKVELVLTAPALFASVLPVPPAQRVVLAAQAVTELTAVQAVTAVLAASKLTSPGPSYWVMPVMVVMAAMVVTPLPVRLADPVRSVAHQELLVPLV